jgi:hypothetical protein
VSAWKKRLVCNVNIYCTDVDEQAITQMFSKNGFNDARAVLITDFDGMIVRPPGVTATSNLTWGDMWVIQNLMILQRMVQADQLRKRVEQQVADVAVAIQKLKDRGLL